MSLKSYLLSKPFCYDLFQEVVGARAARERFFGQYLSPNLQPNSRVLDIGCGTGLLLNVLPSGIRYVGIDHSSEYLRVASEKWEGRGSFIRGDLADSLESSVKGRFDLVIAAGVFHHLPDDVLSRLCLSIASVLEPQGRLVSFDPCFHIAQPRLARLLVSADRGQYVREDRELETLLSRAFARVQRETVDDFLRIPYSHCFMTCSSV
jgi:SAM-dependent methyltransferase